MERSEGASQARASSSPWSVLGPYCVGNRWSSPGTSGHGPRTRTAGHGLSTARTSDGEAARRWVRIPRPGSSASLPSFAE